MITELVEHFEGKLTCLGENTEKYITFSVTTQKEVVGIDKNGEKLQKQYLIGYTLLVMQNLWQVNSEVLLITLLKGFTKFNVNRGLMIKNLKLVE